MNGIKAGGDSTVETFSTKKRKLNYTIHNPNTVKDTVKLLLDILIEANGKKVERKLQEIIDYNITSDLDNEEDNAKVA